jgi:hypothetical protein
MSLQEMRQFLAAIFRTPICHVDENSSLYRVYHRTKTSLRIVMQDMVKAMMLDAKLAGHLPSLRGKANAQANSAPPIHVLTEEHRAELMAMKRGSIRLGAGEGNRTPVSILVG